MSERTELPRLNYLPIPYKGVADEIFFEIASNRLAFISESLQRLKDNNPALTKTLVRTCITGIDMTVILQWPLAYHEIFERTAKKLNSRLFLVEQSLIKTVAHKTIDEIEKARSQGERALARYFKRQEEERERGIIQEMNNSQELGAFWAMLASYRSQLAMVYRNESVTNNFLMPLYDLRHVLLEQHKILEKRS